MITSHIDLGQIVLVLLVGIVGWFVKREIEGLNRRLDNHENLIRGLADTVQYVAGKIDSNSETWNGIQERRKKSNQFKITHDT